jgi:hypothetical protein
MKKLFLLLATCATLCLAGSALAQTVDKAKLVQFYQNYLALVSSGDYVTTSRDDPEGWDTKFDNIAKDAGFEDAAAAVAAGDTMSSDPDIATLRKAVSDKILQQYKPYQE